ncbi:MAG: two-component regulator propeller domain-containing protein, partial [Verrucomicrobiota bacterium]
MYSEFRKKLQKNKTRTGVGAIFQTRHGFEFRQGFLPLLLVFFFFAGSPLRAGIFQSDFNSQMPPGAKVFGNAVLTRSGGVGDTGALRLTEAQPNQRGTLIIDDLDAGQRVMAFNLKLSFIHSGGTNGEKNDGFSINFAPDLTEEIGKNGAGSGIAVSFDTPRKSQVPGFTIHVKSQGSRVATSFFAMRKETNVVKINIQLDAAGAMTISCNDTVVLDRAPLAAFVPFAGRFGIGAQTGKGMDAYSIDNLVIRTETKSRPKNPAPSSESHNQILLPQYSTRVWQIDNTLQNTIQALAQTPDGYLWVGTQYGVARFDGIDFKFFTPQNTPGMTNGFINLLVVTKDGSLLIGTEGGLIQQKKGKFSRIADQLPNNRVRSIYEMKDGSLLIGTAKGLVQYQNGVVRQFLPNAEFNSDVIRCIAEGANGD